MSAIIRRVLLFGLGAGGMGIFLKAASFFEPPPKTADDEDAHRKWLLHFTLRVVIIIVTVVGIILAATMPQNKVRWLTAMVAVDVPCLGFIILNNIGRTRLASWLLVIHFWLVPTIFAFSGGGIRAPAMIAYLIVIFFAGQLLGPRTGLASGIGCWVTMLFFAVLEQAGLLPKPWIVYTPFSFWIVQGMFLAFFTCVQWVVGSAMIGALRRVRQELVERKRTEMHLQESEERYRVVIEQTGQLVYDYDVVTGYITWFGAITDLTGFTPEEFQKVDVTKWEEMVHPEDRTEVLRLLESAMVAVDRYHAQYRFQRKDGSFFYVNDSGAFLPDSSGKSKRMLGAMSDITAQKKAQTENLELTQRLEQHVKERTAELQSAVKELEAFSYSVSHDLQAPLRSINGFTEMLMEDYAEKVTPEMRDLLVRTRAGSQRMQQLINDLLNFSRSSRKPLNKIQLDLKKMAEEIVSELRDLQKNQHIEIWIGNLPGCFGDESLLTQVFSNLIGNAFKFSRLNPSPRIEIDFLKKGDEVVYFVRDNGVGFDMKDAGALFTAFQRLHRKEQFEGTGIGLSIVRRIVERHGGRIWADGEVNKGATFYFTLPLPKEPIQAS